MLFYYTDLINIIIVAISYDSKSISSIIPDSPIVKKSMYAFLFFSAVTMLTKLLLPEP